MQFLIRVSNHDLFLRPRKILRRATKLKVWVAFRFRLQLKKRPKLIRLNSNPDHIGQGLAVTIIFVSSDPKIPLRPDWQRSPLKYKPKRQAELMTFEQLLQPNQRIPVTPVLEQRLLLQQSGNYVFILHLIDSNSKFCLFDLVCTFLSTFLSY